MDLFEEWLSKKETSVNVKRALTDKSCKNSDQNLEHNQNLALIGDRVYSLCLTEIFFEYHDLTERKKKYEEDAYLVKVIAQKYDLLEEIKTKEIEKAPRPKDYDYKRTKNGKSSPHKYIATCVEAIIGAIYMDNHENLEKIKELVKSWTENCIPFAN